MNTVYEKRILKCGSNKGKKKCGNKDLFCDTFDEVLLNQLALIVSNKNKFLIGLENAFKDHSEVINANETLKATQAKIKAFQSKENHFSDVTDDYENNIREELSIRINELEKKAIELQNRLITALNVNNRVKIIKKILTSIPQDLNEINIAFFEDLFQDIVINTDRSIDFVIKLSKTASSTAQYLLPGSVDYLIRKTKHTIKHCIIIL